MIPISLPALRIAALLTLVAGIAGCETVEVVAAPPRAPRSAGIIDLDVPRIMRGTIASETVLRGYQPVIVRGWGLVVGLDRTGSRDVPPDLRAHMLMEMARRGVGSSSSGWDDLKPEALLDSDETAVVIVEAVIPPGAVGRQVRRGASMPGTPFDVRVYADPRTGTTSLEGGRLYTTELRIAQAGEMLPPAGSRQGKVVAMASGPVFVNPFAEPGSTGRDTINRTIGRIMRGGETLEDRPIRLQLATPSHARAEVIQNAINTRFPREPGQEDVTARGQSDETISITVPPSYRDEPAEFVELLRHSTLRQSGGEAVAESIKRVVLNDPATGTAAAWRWEAIGRRALPTVQGLYEHPELQPRLAALRAGSRLRDPLAVPHLITMTRNDSPKVREDAVRLLQDMDFDPRIDEAIRALLDDDAVDVRLAAYEAQALRADPEVRRLVVGGNFLLDLIPSRYPMIYVTQVGQPRIALFGPDLPIDSRAVADLWSGRLLLKGDRDPSYVQVYYRPDEGDRIIDRVPANVAALIALMGHESTVETPDPGLALSYSEVVSALYRLQREGLIDADFRADQDRVLAAIQRNRQGTPIEQRPEFSGAVGSTSGDAGDDDLFLDLAPPPIMESPNDPDQ